MAAEATQSNPPSWRARALSEISKEEKIAAFDRLYEIASKHFESIQQKRAIAGGDDAEYIYEEAMMLTLGRDVYVRGINPLTA